MTKTQIPNCLVIVSCILVISFCLVCANTVYAAGVKKEVKTGNLLYNKGKFDQALKSYERALSKAPDSDVVNFNTGAALYKSGQFEASARHFEKALLSDDKSLQQKAQYNLGNAQYKYGISLEDTELQKAVSLLESSLSHYERALDIDPKDEDARFNYEFVKKELERLREKLQQESQQEQEVKEKQPDQKEQSEFSSQKQKQQEAQEQSSQQQQAQEQEEKAQPQQRLQASQKESEPPMSEQEVRMLLRGYQQQEEPQGLYQQKLPVSELPEPEKDW